MNNKKLIIAIMSFVVIMLCWMCEPKGPEYYDPPVLASHFNGEHFVGSQTCLECHADIYDSHLLTAHYNTSSLANGDNIMGSFKDGSNTIQFDNADVEMVKKGKSFYQQYKFIEGPEKLQTQKIDIVIGSGIKGQSYLTWHDEKLFQMQASYYPPTDSWINSPGFPKQIIQRPIRDGCLKCHVTFATNRDFSGRGNQYDKDRMVFGVDCEKCHRPAQKHVIYHRNNPDSLESKFMLHLDTLSRQLRLDACAQCHSGPRDAILKGNSFTYLVGEPLNEYSRNFHTGQKASELDVHGNQYGLLTSSKCFIESPQMDCGTCHDPHKNQRGDEAYFNQKCVGCHNTSTSLCSGDVSELTAMGNNCISCHMPTIASKMMSVQLTADSLQTGVLVRTHLIGIYSNESKDQHEELDTSSLNQLKELIGKY